MLVAHLLGRVVRYGTLRVIDAAGCVHIFGRESGPTVTIRLHDRRLDRDLFLWTMYTTPKATAERRHG